MQALDYSVIAGLKAENKLISQELTQLKSMNLTLMEKVDNFEK